MVSVNVLLVSLLCWSSLVFAQGGPMQAAPGEPPPPQGWDLKPDPNAGVHLPPKKKGKKYQLRMGPGKVGAPTPAPSSH